jgi:LAO/AO transport system kinase
LRKNRVQELVEKARQGSIRAASRLISLLEDDPSRLPEILKGSADWPEPGLSIGITGPPGVGKSTVVDRLITEWRRARPDWLIAVVAVDPSSVFSGGAVLGDRVRMMQHATDPMVFIRSLASRGHLGGLTLGIRGTLRILGLLGCRLVLIETVGVGQSEIEVSEVADLTVILLAPGQGDGIQMIKAGLLETGDVFVVNKADREGADRLLGELTTTLALMGISHHGVSPRLLRVSAAHAEGISDLRKGIEEQARLLDGVFRERRRRALKEEIRLAILETTRRRIEEALEKQGDLRREIDRLLQGEATVQDLAGELLVSACENDQKR